jgi:bifunctional UDP-N-acetylglucosamine pyrophosphorylase/glucosamine-1-phosphate N-acetyltransferase
MSGIGGIAKTKPVYVILAAGRGTRLWPVGEGLPKCMVRVLGKPLVEWVIDAVLPNAEKIVLVVGYKKQLVVDYFSQKPYAQKIAFVEQTEQKGTAHALLQAREAVGGSNFVTINGDSFADPTLYELMTRETEKSPREFFAVGQYREDAREYGLFEEEKEEGKENGFLKKVTEKPASNAPVPGVIYLGNCFLPPEFFDYLARVQPSPRGEFEATDAINAFACDHRTRVVRFDGFRSEITYFWNHLDINLYALRNLMRDERLGVIEPGAFVSGKLHLGKGSVIRAGTRIDGPVYVGDNCLVGPNAFLREGAIIENSCHIGNSEIKNSVVMNNADVPHFSYVGDSVLCEDVNIGGGTMMANLRFDEKIIKVSMNGKIIDSGRRKLGCAIGRGTKIGANCVINCGVLVGSNCRVYPGVVVKKNLLDGEKLGWNDEVKH